MRYVINTSYSTILMKHFLLFSNANVIILPRNIYFNIYLVYNANLVNLVYLEINFHCDNILDGRDR